MTSLMRGRRRRRGALERIERNTVASQLGSSALAVTVLVIVLAAIFRLAPGQSPWPVFVLVELPSAAVAFALLTLTSPR
jgi:hypothetical protein